MAFARAVEPDEATSAAADVASGAFLLHRFFSLRQVVASLRLGPRAWAAAGYGDDAQVAVRALGRRRGLPIEPLRPAPPRSTLPAFRGMCAVNDHVTAIGFKIEGWQEVRSYCSAGTLS